MPNFPLDSTPFTLERVGDAGNCKIEVCNDKKTQVIIIFSLVKLSLSSFSQIIDLNKGELARHLCWWTSHSHLHLSRLFHERDRYGLQRRSSPPRCQVLRHFFSEFLTGEFFIGEYGSVERVWLSWGGESILLTIYNVVDGKKIGNSSVNFLPFSERF